MTVKLIRWTIGPDLFLNWLRIPFSLVLTAILIIALSGVVMAGDENGEEKKEDPSVQFFDSGAFDSQLSRALRADSPQVFVTFPAEVNVNKIPERLDKWFAMVEEYGGTVELKVDEDYPVRGVVSAIIDLIIGAYQLARHKITYGPVEDYNAVIYYIKDEGTITKVVFSRKDAPGAG